MMQIPRYVAALIPVWVAEVIISEVVSALVPMESETLGWAQLAMSVAVLPYIAGIRLGKRGYVRTHAVLGALSISVVTVTLTSVQFAFKGAEPMAYFAAIVGTLMLAGPFQAVTGALGWRAGSNGDLSQINLPEQKLFKPKDYRPLYTFFYLISAYPVFMMLLLFPIFASSMKSVFISFVFIPYYIIFGWLFYFKYGWFLPVLAASFISTIYVYTMTNASCGRHWWYIPVSISAFLGSGVLYVSYAPDHLVTPLLVNFHITSYELFSYFILSGFLINFIWFWAGLCRGKYWDEGNE